MHKVILLASMFLLVCCGPSEEDCQQLCDWAGQVCTSDDGCMEDCMDAASSDVDYAMGQCLDTSPSTCKSANCCLRFTYTDYYWQQNCYQN